MPFQQLKCRIPSFTFRQSICVFFFIDGRKVLHRVWSLQWGTRLKHSHSGKGVWVAGNPNRGQSCPQAGCHVQEETGILPAALPLSNNKSKTKIDSLNYV